MCSGYRLSVTPCSDLYGARELTRPDKLIRHLLSGDRPWYLVQLLAPVGFVALIRPEIALLGTLPLLSNLVSTFWYQSQIEYHYAVQFVPILVLGSMWAISRLQEHLRQWLVVAVLISTLVSMWVWAPLPLMRTQMASYSPSHPAVAAARQAIDEVPDDAVVSAFHTLTAHMARRERIYVFPVPFRRVLYGPNVFAKDDRLDFVDEIQYVILPRELDGEAALDWQREQLSYRIVFGNDYWTVYERLP
ncbi:MAG: DUF2079 domain-containing protein [Actinobacteria bacterium]|nr:DUF2079 domain-containing protein [Actinomycetota bacterium]